MMLLIRSRSTDRAVFVAGSRYWPSPGPDWTCGSSGGFGALARLGLRRLALDELLADQRLRADRAEGVLAEVVVVGVVDLQDDRGLLVVREVDRLDPADDDAADLHVLARDHERGVVEDRAHAVAAAVARSSPSRTRPGRRPRRSTAAMASRRFMGRGARSRGRSRGCRCTSRHGALPSAGACEAPPGQRATAVGLVGTPGTRWAGGHGGQEVRGLVVAEGVEDRADARVVAVRVVVGRALAEVAEPADEVRRVRAEEREDPACPCSAP